MKKLGVKIAVVVVAALLALTGLKNMIGRAVIGGACKAATGLDLKIGSLSLGILSGRIDVKDLRLFNPPGYKDRLMLHSPEVFVDFDMGTVFSATKHVRRLRLYVAELTILRDQKGRLNLESLRPAGSKRKAAKSPEVRIDEFSLRIDRVIYKDYASGVSQTFELNINDTYRDVSDVRALAPILFNRALTNSALRALANFDTADLLKNFQASGVDISSLGLDKIQGLGGNLAERIPDLGGKTGEALKKFGDIFGALVDKK